ncbi:MAG: hypothetical protein AAGU25_01700 [bacterium]|jgi:heme/copper-type cytochrome/quinol oxidase subunit 4
MRQFLTQPKVVSAILILQFIPLLLLPPSSYSLKTQEWWLPLLLTILAVFSVVQVSLRRNTAAWPWSLISFAQGFNIISRLMLIMPHITMNVEGAQVFNAVYFSMTVISIALSAGIIWLCDLPEVKSTYLRA